MTGRQKASAFFITLCVILSGAAVVLNVSWIVVLERHPVLLVLGIVFFVMIIAGLVVYTVFLVREIRRSEQHDSFINAVTHELKTPLASIRLYLETLQARDISPEQRKQFYDIMLADTDRLHYTVDQVLKAGVAGQKERRPAEALVDMEHLVNEAIEVARLRHHLQNGALTLERSPRLTDSSVFGDPEDLRTAVSNLLDNAVKYSPNGVEVKVELAPTPGDPGSLQIHVVDKGVGIARAHLGSIFKRFYRIPRTKRQVMGTGLGLYIVQSIAKKHGGRAYAESEGEGKGSVFTLELPKAAR
jgi:two-component system, OmpR family, sensor histidine kinase SenX3